MKHLLFLLLPILNFAQTNISNTAIWDLKGNVITNNTYFLGNKNAKDLIVKTNNTEALKVFTHGGIRFTQYNSATDYQGTAVGSLGFNANGDVLTMPILLTKSSVNVSAVPVQYVAGNLQTSASNGVILTSQNGTKYKVSISNDGQLQIQLVNP